MYSQANERAGKELRPPIRALPSVIVDPEKVLREADGPVVARGQRQCANGWKGGRSRVRLESWTGELVRSPKITSALMNQKTHHHM